MFHSDVSGAAESVVDGLRRQKLTLVTAESCTGGLLAGSVTAIAGSSDVFDRGFITYSNAAKTEMLGVSAALISAQGAVSAEVAEAMARGALRHTNCDLAVSVTGIAGPGGGSAAKPVGLVYVAVARRNGPSILRQFTFGDIGRNAIRSTTVAEALAILSEVLATWSGQQQL